jgi:hypothetical protein
LKKTIEGNKRVWFALRRRRRRRRRRRTFGLY